MSKKKKYKTDYQKKISAFRKLQNELDKQKEKTNASN